MVHSVIWGMERQFDFAIINVPFHPLCGYIIKVTIFVDLKKAFDMFTV